MRAELRKILGMAMAQLREQIRYVSLENIDEATFRSMVLRAMKTRLPAAIFQVEWDRYDLLVQVSSLNILIEFKFYVCRQSHSLDRRHLHWKGGAGPRNAGEFWTCVKKLRHLSVDGIDRKYLILVYSRAGNPRSQYSFAKSYDDVKAGPDIRVVERIKHGLETDVTCTLLEIA
jgi:hypothetical protein